MRSGVTVFLDYTAWPSIAAYAHFFILRITLWHDWACNLSCHLMIGDATRRTTSLSVVRLLATCPDLSHDFATTGGATNCTIARRCHDWSCYPSPDATVYHAIGRRRHDWSCDRLQDSTTDRPIGRRTSRLIVRSVTRYHD